MKNKYKTLAIREDVYKNLDVIEKIYRRHHPEFTGIPITKTKLLIELIKIYSEGQKERVLIHFQEDDL